jgi:Dehydrogenases (flavoproteins)
MWLNYVGLKPPKDVIADEVTGYDIYFEGKELVSYRGNRTILYILKRGYFERWLQQEAEKEGAKIIYKAFYPSVLPDEHLVLAEGAGGFIKKSMGLDEKRKLTDFHTGVQLIGETPNVEEHVVKIYLTK